MDFDPDRDRTHETDNLDSVGQATVPASPDGQAEVTYKWEPSSSEEEAVHMHASDTDATASTVADPITQHLINDYDTLDPPTKQISNTTSPPNVYPLSSSTSQTAYFGAAPARSIYGLFGNNRWNNGSTEPPVEPDNNSDNDNGDEMNEEKRAKTMRRMRALRLLVLVLSLFGGGVAVGVLAVISANTNSSSSASTGTTADTTDQNSTNSPSTEVGDGSASPDAGRPAPKPPIAAVPSRSPTVAPVIDNIFVSSRAPTASPLSTSAPISDPPSSNPTQILTAVPTEDVTRVPISSTNSSSVNSTEYLVGVYYYPWHGDGFHNQEGYVRKQIVPRQYPSLGEYNDSDPAIIAQHIKMFRRANVGLLVTSWWGPNRLEDNNTKDVIMTHSDIGKIKIALHYESSGRLGKELDDMENARSDIQYMCDNYFGHPNYYTIDDRPVLVIYLSRKIYEIGWLEEALLTMRSTAAKCGQNIYLIGDQVFSQAPDPNEVQVPFWYFDAVTNYDIYGSEGRPKGYAGREAVAHYYQQMAEWQGQALLDDCRFIPAVSPGYNDRGVRPEADNPALSRRLTPYSEEGSLFHFQLKHAKELADPSIDNLILVNSFNEWHEDTQIEPVALGEPASWPQNKTQGLEYVGYGNLYLDILGASTSSSVEEGGIFDYLFDDEL